MLLLLRWTAQNCRFGAFCWRPGCLSTHASSARDEFLRTLASDWTEQTFLMRTDSRPLASGRHHSQRLSFRLLLILRVLFLCVFRKLRGALRQTLLGWFLPLFVRHQSLLPPRILLASSSRTQGRSTLRNPFHRNSFLRTHFSENSGKWLFSETLFREFTFPSLFCPKNLRRLTSPKLSSPNSGVRVWGLGFRV